MMKFVCNACLMAFLILVTTYTQAQEKSKIELLGAKILKFDKKLGLDAQRLIGNVRFSHKGALMFCDSAYLYNANNSLDAFGHVRIVQGDTLTMYSDKLYYNGNTQYVKVRDNVTLKDKAMTLTTNTLDYDRKIQTAIFYDRGTITSTKNQNKLVSCEGIYDSRIEFFYFRDSVVLNNPNYRVETDTLNYANNSEIAYFEGPTFIFSDENTIYCENGWYDTKKDISQFNENAYLNNGSEVLRGDSLWYSRNEGIGRAYYNVSIIDTTDRLLIRGEYGNYMERQGRSLVTGNAEMVQYDDVDSLFLHGDTLLAVNDSIGGDRVYAYPRVKFFRKDMQGAADSVIYAKSDSLIFMFTNPVLWSEDLQITGDTILIKTYDGAVQNLYVHDHSFMVNRLDSVKYNQIKGKRLTGYFRNNELYKVFINGNGQSLYYASEEKKENTSDTLATGNNSGTPAGTSRDSLKVNTEQDTLTDNSAENKLQSNTLNKTQDTLAIKKDEPEVSYLGVNKAICSNIAIYLSNNQVKRIMFLKEPDGAFYPLFQFPKEEAFFDGFKWDGERRPRKREDIFVVDIPVLPEGVQQLILDAIPTVVPEEMILGKVK